MTLVVRDPHSVDDVRPLRSWARHGAEHGRFTAGGARAWERGIDDAIARGSFLYSLTFFLTAGVK